MKYLESGTARDPDEKKTPGIRQVEKIQTTTWRPDGCDIRVNIWDFAGQEITHGTHRYFLTERSLYLLVLEDRRQDHPPVEKWLNTIASVAGDAPVIVVINKSDNGKADLRLDEDDLKRRYAQIIGFVRTACNDDDWSRNSIAVLQRLIADTLVEDPRLDALRNPVPEHWLAIRNEVERRSRVEAVQSTTEDFKDICLDTSVVGDRVVDTAELQRGILRLLHEMGVVVAHGLTKQAPAAFREITLLDPNWLTDAIYSILNDTKLQERGGRFTHDDLTACLDPEKYPEERTEFILSMMQDTSIELCFPIFGSPGEYLAPDAMPVNSPDFSGWEDGALRFRLRYEQLPRSVMTRFIVRMAQRLEKPTDAWRNGARLKVQDSDVLVRREGQTLIDIAIKGNQQRDALTVLRDTFDEIHQSFDDLRVRSFVPMPDDPSVEEDYEHLLRLERQEGYDYRHWPTNAKRGYSVGELLAMVDRFKIETTIKPNAQEDTKPLPSSESTYLKPANVIAVLVATVVSLTLGSVGECIWAIWSARRSRCWNFGLVIDAFNRPELHVPAVVSDMGNVCNWTCRTTRSFARCGLWLDASWFWQHRLVGIGSVGFCRDRNRRICAQ